MFVLEGAAMVEVWEQAFLEAWEHTQGITRSQISMEVSFLKKDSLSLRQFWSKIV